MFAMMGTPSVVFHIDVHFRREDMNWMYHRLVPWLKTVKAMHAFFYYPVAYCKCNDRCNHHAQWAFRIYAPGLV